MDSAQLWKPQFKEIKLIHFLSGCSLGLEMDCAYLAKAVSDWAGWDNSESGSTGANVQEDFPLHRLGMDKRNWLRLASLRPNAQFSTVYLYSWLSPLRDSDPPETAGISQHKTYGTLLRQL